MANNLICDGTYNCAAASHFRDCQVRNRIIDESAPKADVAGNFVTLTDSDGNLYVLAVPSKHGQAFYTTDKRGDLIVVARFKRENMKPQFTLAPAEPTEGERALGKTLDEIAEDYRE